MANHESSKKRIRQTIKRTERNRHIRSTLRSLIKQVREAVASGDGSAAKLVLATACCRIDRAVTQGVFHRRTASRYVSRLTHHVQAMQ